MEHDIKKLVLGDCEVTDAGCQVMADIVKVNDTIGELDLPENTNSDVSPLKRLRKRRQPSTTLCGITMTK